MCIPNMCTCVCVLFLNAPGARQRQQQYMSVFVFTFFFLQTFVRCVFPSGAAFIFFVTMKDLYC